VITIGLLFLIVLSSTSINTAFTPHAMAAPSEKEESKVSEYHSTAIQESIDKRFDNIGQDYQFAGDKGIDSEEVKQQENTNTTTSPSSVERDNDSEEVGLSSGPATTTETEQPEQANGKVKLLGTVNVNQSFAPGQKQQPVEQEPIVVPYRTAIAEDEFNELKKKASSGELVRESGSSSTEVIAPPNAKQDIENSKSKTVPFSLGLSNPDFSSIRSGESIELQQSTSSSAPSASKYLRTPLNLQEDLMV
jgi:hypothetical protein